MSNFAEYFSKPNTLDEYKHFLIAKLIAEYNERGEQMPRFSFNNGKLETESQELRLKYRYMLQGVQVVATFLDYASARKKQQQNQA